MAKIALLTFLLFPAAVDFGDRCDDDGDGVEGDEDTSRIRRLLRTIWVRPSCAHDEVEKLTQNPNSKVQIEAEQNFRFQKVYKQRSGLTGPRQALHDYRATLPRRCKLLSRVDGGALGRPKGY